jgi:hypothetical protein
MSSFQITLLIDFENILLPNNLIIVSNHGDDEEDVGKSFSGMKDKQEHPIRVGDQYYSKFQSLTSNPTQSIKPPRLQMTFKTCPISDMDVLHMHVKLRR